MGIIQRAERWSNREPSSPLQPTPVPASTQTRTNEFKMATTRIHSTEGQHAPFAPKTDVCHVYHHLDSMLNLTSCHVDGNNYCNVTNHQKWKIHLITSGKQAEQIGSQSPRGVSVRCAAEEGIAGVLVHDVSGYLSLISAS
jgi:hypothetical protein